jgi:hypothetical protein
MWQPVRQNDGAKGMGAIGELQRDCGYCRQPITLKWKTGPMPSEGVCLVVDQVRDKCWAKFLTDSNGKRALVGARCGAGTA